MGLRAPQRLSLELTELGRLSTEPVRFKEKEDFNASRYLRGHLMNHTTVLGIVEANKVDLPGSRHKKEPYDYFTK